MRKNAYILLIFSLALSLFSCKKDISSVDALVNDASVDYYKEAEFPVQTCISKSVNANIGGYVEALPASYDEHPNTTYPLLIYIHGIANCGNGTIPELQEFEKGALPGYIKRQDFPANFIIDGKTYQFIVICPQVKSWPYPKDVDDLIDYCIDKYRVNTKKIYLCGGSMGGGATWDYAIDHGNRLSAIVPMAGASWPTHEKAKKIAASGVCVWAFHDENDPSVPSWYSINYVDYINDYNPRITAKLTLLHQDKHNCWKTVTDPAYKVDGENIYEWMLKFQKAN